MKFILNDNNLTIDEPMKVTTGSIADYNIAVEMDESWSGLSIIAKICKEKENIAYERAVIDKHVLIDIDKLERYTIGFIGYIIDEGEKVYQKSTNLKVIPYVKGAGEIETTEEPDIPTPEEWELYLQQVQEFIDNANEIINTANNLDIDVSKVGETATVTITKKDETTKSVEIHDGEKGEDGDDYVITQQDYQDIANVVKSQITVPTKTSQLTNDSGFIDNSVNNLINYTLTTQTGSKIDLEINSSNYQLTAKLYDKNNNLISTSSTIDLPIESMVVNASYSNGILTLTLQNGNTIDVDISDIVSGLVKPEDLADYVKNTDYANSQTGGVFKTSSSYNTAISNGALYALNNDYATYQGKGNGALISKGTLENVITGKELVNKTYVDNIVGDIESILEELDVRRWYLMSIATRINAIEEHIGNAYDKLEDLGIDLTNVDKNIDNIAEMLDTVYEDYPKVTGTGTSVTLNGTKKGKIGLDIKGNSTQNTTTGKNLYRVVNKSGTVGNLNYSVEDGVITLNGTMTSEGTIILSNDGNLVLDSSNSYTYNVKKISGTCSAPANTNCVLSTAESGGILYIRNIADSAMPNTFTGVSGTALVTRLYIGSGVVFSNFKMLVQVEKGSSFTSFEKYTGGIASPNPSYEQPILSAGDNGTISEKIVNKNYLPNNATTQTINGVTFTKNSDGSVTLNGTSTSTINYYFYNDVNNPIVLQPNNYTYSLVGRQQSKNNLQWQAIDTSYNNAITGSSADVKKTVTYNEKVLITKVFTYINANVTFNNNTMYPMIANTNDTTYIAHQEQTYTIPVQQPMRSIGDVRDEFVKVNGSWFERHNIGIGDENSFWSTINITSTIGSDLYGFACNNSLNIASNSQLGAVISNIFEAKVLGATSDTTNINNVRFNMGIAKHTSTSQIVITLKKTYISEQTQTALLNFLASKDFYFYYLLSTPQDLPCTEEQIAILENLPTSYNEQTNIYSLDVTPAYIEAEALKGE